MTAISASLATTCAVADGQAYCWGDNLANQLGVDDINPNDPAVYFSAVPVAIEPGATAGGTIVHIAGTGLTNFALLVRAGPLRRVGVVRRDLLGGRWL